MVEPVSRYSCDHCRTRKIRCSRELSGCEPCRADSRKCAYSRSGIIRRNRRRNHGLSQRSERLQGKQNPNINIKTNSGLPRIDQDPGDPITSESEPLRRLGGDRYSSAPLPLLFSDFNSFWQDPELIDMIERMKPSSSQFFTFEQQAESWVQVVENILDLGQPLMAPIETDILKTIVLSPEKVREKGYLLMFYGIMLTVATSDASFSEDTRVKLKWNLWLCLNDARLLLQPSEINIQALILLACHVQDFHTPSLCWMVSTTAFRMFQALGTPSIAMDGEARQRRSDLFWFLNSLDKSLALIFGRPPVFHRAMCEEIPMPSMHRLQSFQPHTKFQSHGKGASNGHSSLFGAHLLHHMHLVSKITADIWTHNFDNPGKLSKLEEIRGDLNSWHEDTSKVLEASLLTERPLLDAGGIRALELGIRCVHFQFHYLTVLLLKSQRNWKDDCLDTSRNALLLLDGLVSGSVDVYNGVVWHLLYCPFTPFFVLFADCLANRGSPSSQRALESMEHLPRFLEEMTPRHPLASKLLEVSVMLMNRAKFINESGADVEIGQCLTLNSSPLSPETFANSNTSDRNPPPLDPNNLGFLRGFFQGFDSHQSLEGVRSQETADNLNMGILREEVTTEISNPTTESQSLLTAQDSMSHEQQYEFLADSMFDWFAWESYGDGQSQ